MNEQSGKSKADLIDEKLMGLEINDGGKSYGIVCEITLCNGNYTVHTNLGYKFNAGLILNLVAAANRAAKAAAKAEANTDPNVEILMPESNFTNTLVTKRHKAHSKTMRMHAPVDTVAKINGERIDITSNVTSVNAFPEEYRDNPVKDNK